MATHATHSRTRSASFNMDQISAYHKKEVATCLQQSSEKKASDLESKSSAVFSVIQADNFGLVSLNPPQPRQCKVIVEADEAVGASQECSESLSSTGSPFSADARARVVVLETLGLVKIN